MTDDPKRDIAWLEERCTCADTLDCVPCRIITRIQVLEGKLKEARRAARDKLFPVPRG